MSNVNFDAQSGSFTREHVTLQRTAMLLMCLAASKTHWSSLSLASTLCSYTILLLDPIHDNPRCWDLVNTVAMPWLIQQPGKCSSRYHVARLQKCRGALSCWHYVWNHVHGQIFSKRAISSFHKNFAQTHSCLLYTGTTFPIPIAPEALRIWCILAQCFYSV
jgi:hypothetical protein